MLKNKRTAIVISVLVFVIGGIYGWSNFNKDSYDTYYTWNSFYFIATSLILILIYGAFYLLINRLDKKKWYSNNSLFYLSMSLTLIGYMTITVVKYLMDSAVKDTFTFDITTVVLIDPIMFKTLNTCFVGILAFQLPLFINLVIDLIRKKGL